MTARLFGTDGMRGVAYAMPLDRPTVTRLGAALGAYLREFSLPNHILLAGDTRASTAILASWAGGAFLKAGGAVTWAGVLPTPAVSHLVRDVGGFGTGMIVSASHNPAADNGIKLVAGDGSKWREADERRLEEGLLGIADEPQVEALPDPDATLGERYLELLVRTLPPRALAGTTLVVDAANGAGSPFAGALLARLGAEVVAIHSAPDGTNINQGCGALHPSTLAAQVVRHGADAGIALDGDADRAILITHAGRVLDGDEILLLWGKALHEAGRLPRDTVVATVMSNLGLEVALREIGVRVVRCAVGDREVWETMRRVGAALGGEQSGHVICSHLSVTGDGLLTAAHVLAHVRERGVSLEDAARMLRFPQVLVNVRVGRRRPLADVPELTAAITETETAFAGAGRVLVRYSGTEPLLRIMVEASNKEQAETTAHSLAEVARRHLGEA